MLVFFLSSITDNKQRGFLERLYYKNKGVLFGVAIKLLDDPHLAEDAIQQAFLRIIASSTHLKLVGLPDNRQRNYLIAVVRNVCFDMCKKNNVILTEPDKRIIDDKNDPLDYVLTEELFSEIDRALNELKPKYRDALLLRIAFGHSVKQIAIIMGTNEGDIKTSLHRARKLLAKAIREKEGGTHE